MFVTHVRYIERAQGLLLESKMGANPFEGYSVSAPDGVDLTPGSEAFDMYDIFSLRRPQSSR